MACKALLDLVIKSHRQNGSEFIKPAPGANKKKDPGETGSSSLSSACVGGALGGNSLVPLDLGSLNMISRVAGIFFEKK
jgi:hypothetical protein